MNSSRNSGAYFTGMALIILYGVVLLRTAWISDDAAITLRVVLNTAHGWGPTYNIAERVQAFTHPLWFVLLALANAVLGNVFAVAFALSFALALLAFVLALRRGVATGWAVVCALVLIGSKAFVDYSGSGLENPLAYLLVALFVHGMTGDDDAPPQLAWLVFLASLIYLTRPDLGLLIAPLLVVAYWRSRHDWRRGAWQTLLGTSPAIVWTAFSLAYYGFPFPNTAYAKLGNNVDGWDLVRQGGYYFLDSLDRDPLTLLAIALAVVSGLRSNMVNRGLAFGIGIYLLYVARIGGDFMSGRFFAVPLFAAVLILARMPAIGGSMSAALAVAVAAVSLLSPGAPLMSDSRYSNEKLSLAGIADERGYYFQRWGLIAGSRERFVDLPAWPDASGALDIVELREVCGGLGYTGLYTGPWVHFVDRCGLSDPLLARLPPNINPNWRAGHFERTLPEGYLDSIRGSDNRIRDDRLKEYYDAIRLITRAPLDAPGRWDAIMQMNLGRYDNLIEREGYGAAPSLTLAAEALTTVRTEGSRWDAPGNIVFRRLFPVTVTFGALQTGKREIDLSFDSNDQYRLTFMRGARALGSLVLGPRPLPKGGLTRYVLPLPAGISTDGFDAVLVEALEGDGAYALGHFVVR
ncbi:MAG: hypothetical protein HZB53_21365 [Chloroflexi bacterium]|nr:hypothetical protein [Chloroflexota bacterium]